MLLSDPSEELSANGFWLMRKDGKIDTEGVELEEIETSELFKALRYSC